MKARVFLMVYGFAADGLKGLIVQPTQFAL